MNGNKNSPYSTGIASVLDSLIYQLKLLLSIDPKVSVSDSLLFVEQAKSHWRLGNEEQALTALQSAQDSCVSRQKNFDLTEYRQIISEVVDLLKNNEKTDKEKNRIIMLLWLKITQLQPSVIYYKKPFFSAQHVVMPFLTGMMNLFMLFVYGLAIFSLIQLWKISIASFAVLCFITAGCLLLLRAFPSVPTAIFVGFVPLIIVFSLGIFYDSLDVLPGALYYLLFMVPLMMILLDVGIIRGYFQGLQYGKLSYVCLRSREESGARIWEAVVVDAKGNIVRARQSRFRSRVMSPFWNLSSSISLPILQKGYKKLETFSTWWILPLFLFNPPQQVPKTTGFTWWLKSQGLWFFNSAMMVVPFTWKYKEDRTCLFIPLDRMRNPILWKNGIEVGVEFSDEEIAEFLSRCPSPLKELPGYESFGVWYGIEKR